jgi:simple sugar transport system ATP-binding protein
VFYLKDTNPPLLKLCDIRKSFGTISALVGIDFVLYPGEVVALLGDNGAGKSTLVKILSGVQRADSGTMTIKDIAVDISTYSVAAARRLGVETVHQGSSLGEKQPLWRNIFIGRHLTNRFGFIDVGREKAETLTILHGRLGLRGVGIDADAEVKVLSGGERQELAIGRAIHFQSDIVILDEPTTALSLKEVNKVLDFINHIKEGGKSCIFISHNMRHAYLAADRFFLMDRGAKIGEYHKNKLSYQELMLALINAASLQEEG